MSGTATNKFNPPRGERTKETYQKAREQSEIAQAHNRRMLRISRTANGYIVTEGRSSEQYVYAERADAFAHANRYFDELDRNP